MKYWMQISILTVLAISTFVGCGKNKSNNAGQTGYTCDAYGRCYNNNPYGPGYGVAYGVNNPNAVILAGNIPITNPDAYRSYLKDNGACVDNFMLDNCGSMSNTPLNLQVHVDDYKFSSPDKMSSGTLSIVTAAGPATYHVGFRMINNNTGFDTAVTGPPYTKAYNRLLLVRLTGRPTDSQLLAELFYKTNGNIIGSGVVNRQNRPAATTPVPTPYGQYPQNQRQYPNGQNPYYNPRNTSPGFRRL